MSASDGGGERDEPAASPRQDETGGAPSLARGTALAHIVFNALLAAGCGLLFWRSEALPSSVWEPLGAGSFPRLALGGLIGFNLVLIAVQVPALTTSVALPRGAVPRWLWQHRLAFATMALFLGYVTGIQWSGFAWASFVFLLATQIVLGARTPRGLLLAAVIALAFSFGLNALFGQVFNIILPAGASG